eukprot:scpid40633/ scgid33527/ Exocyst complex component 6B; Exocyst complex component Sec15B; SEC15-like protein 2
MASTAPAVDSGIAEGTDEKDAPGSSHFDALVTELESSEGQLGATLRAVYDESKQGAFLQHLEARIRQHDKDIERMCNHHYQGFIESVNELLKVGSDARKLKVKILSANDDFQEAGSKLVKNGDELIALRIIQRNIAAAMESLTFCRPVLELYAKLREQMKERRYYPALKTLEQLEHTYLPRVSRYTINQMMKARIPKLRDSIKEASMTDLRHFLEEVRSKSESIGKLAMQQTHYRANLELSRRGASEPNRKLPDVDLDKSVQDMVDFSPIYRCLHIFTVLGERETFEAYYHRQRWHQARLVLEFPGNQVSMALYRSYFYQVAGFFVVEDTVHSTTQGLITKKTVNELWELAVSKIASALRTHTSLFNEVQMIRSIKELVVHFCCTLQSFDFQVNQLYDLLLETREQYCELLMRTWYTVIKSIFEVDNYSPIVLRSENEAKGLARSFPLSDYEVSTFPAVLPFSEFVPSVYDQIREFIHSCAGFAENLNLSLTETDDMVRKSTNLLLTRTVSACLGEQIHDSRLSLAQLVQISVNTTYLEKACEGLSTFIADVTGVSSDTSMLPRIYGVSSFKDARADAEDMIYTKLQAQLDQFYELADYKWMAPEKAFPSDPVPSQYIQDMVSFLRNTFISLTTLPEHVAMTACMTSCKHIARTLMALLVDETGSFNMTGLNQFSSDIGHCEGFAGECPVKGFTGDQLVSAFSPVRQIVALFQSMDWSGYIADYGTDKTKYPQVRPSQVAKVLSRYREKEQKKGLLGSFRGSDRDRRRLLETFVKRLWEIDAEGRD